MVIRGAYVIDGACFNPLVRRHFCTRLLMAAKKTQQAVRSASGQYGFRACFRQFFAAIASRRNAGEAALS